MKTKEKKSQVRLNKGGMMNRTVSLHAGPEAFQQSSGQIVESGKHHSTFRGSSGASKDGSNRGRYSRQTPEQGPDAV